MNKQTTTWLSVLASVFLFLFSISFWFYNDIYNKENFQNHVLKALSTQEARTAMAGLIIEESFQNRPILKNILLEQTQPALAGVLDSPRIQNILKIFAGRVHDSLFSPTPRAVAIDISGIKTFVERLLAVAESLTETDRPNIRIPDQIVIIRQGEIPSISAFGNSLIWSGPLMLVAFIAITGYTFWKTVDRKWALIVFGVSLAIGALVMLLIGMWYEPVILAGIRSSYGKVVGEQIYTEFYDALRREFVVLLFIGAILYALGYFLPRQQLTKKSTR